MSEPVTPKAERRVIDGEVVEEKSVKAAKPKGTSQSASASKGADASSNANAKRRAHNRAQAESPVGNQENAQKSSALGTKKQSLLAKSWVKKTVFLGGFLIVIGGVLFYTRPDMDWQIEHINRLQAQVVQLHQTNTQLVDKIEAQQAGLDARIAKALSQAASVPEDQAGLEAIKSETQQQIDVLYQQVQTDLSAFNSQVAEKLAEISTQAMAVSSSNKFDLTEFSAFQRTVEAQLKQIDDGLAQLSAFKTEQEQRNAQPVRQVEPVKSVERVNTKQVQQWMVELNSQWLLRGDVQQTEAQLLALEQAVALSELPNISEIARTIGQDLSDVKAYSAQSSEAQVYLKSQLGKLTAQMKAIPKPDLQRSKTAINQAKLNAEKEVSDEASSPFNALLDKFSGLVNVKKRETETDLSSLEELLLHDVLMQRLELLIDRVNWAVNLESQTELRSALIKVSDFVGLHFKAHSPAFEQVIAPLKSVNFSHRKPLAVLSLNAE